MYEYYTFIIVVRTDLIDLTAQKRSFGVTVSPSIDPGSVYGNFAFEDATDSISWSSSDVGWTK